ncbi:MAG: glutathione peroxidase [Pseudomonadota bacterium]
MHRPLLIFLAMSITACSGDATPSQEGAQTHEAQADESQADAEPADAIAQSSAHDFSFISIDGAPMPLSRFAGQPVLIVNTASLCGFTKQYAGLQSLYETYADKGLIVLGVPSNDFGGQEPGANAEIKGFCEANFNIRFPLTEKTTVTGANAHPFYRWARETLGAEAAPKWNFHKYLIGPDGALIAAFDSATTPQSNRITDAVDAAVSG